MTAAKLSSRGIAFEDLVSVGRLALVRECRRWRPELEFSFAKQMERAIHSAMCKMFVQKRGWIRGVPAKFVPLEEVSSERDQGATLVDVLPGDTRDDPERVVDRIDLMRVLDTLPDRDRQVLRLYCGLHGGAPETLEHIGGRLGMSKARAQVILIEAAARLKARLTRGA